MKKLKTIDHTFLQEGKVYYKASIYGIERYQYMGVHPRTSGYHIFINMGNNEPVMFHKCGIPDIPVSDDALAECVRLLEARANMFKSLAQ